MCELVQHSMWVLLYLLLMFRAILCIGCYPTYLNVNNWVYILNLLWHALLLLMYFLGQEVSWDQRLRWTESMQSSLLILIVTQLHHYHNNVTSWCMATPSEFVCHMMIKASFNAITTWLLHGSVIHEQMYLLWLGFKFEGFKCLWFLVE